MTTAMKFKDACSLGKKAMTKLDSVLKGRATRDQIANIVGS